MHYPSTWKYIVNIRKQFNSFWDKSANYLRTSHLDRIELNKIPAILPWDLLVHLIHCWTSLDNTEWWEATTYFCLGYFCLTAGIWLERNGSTIHTYQSLEQTTTVQMTHPVIYSSSQLKLIAKLINLSQCRVWQFY